jgi:biopolymer transport protein ExbD
MRRPPHAGVVSGEHGIDLAPMLDFVVNLLIFFIITAVFVKQTGIEVNRSNRVATGNEVASKSFVVDEQGQVSVDSKPIDFRAVRAHVEQFRATGVTGVVVLADRGAPTGVVISVTDQIRLGGITDITFTTAMLKKPLPH